MNGETGNFINARRVQKSPLHALSVIEKMMNMLKEEQGKYGDTLPLRSKNPEPVNFVPPKEQSNSYPGGLAPEDIGI